MECHEDELEKQPLINSSDDDVVVVVGENEEEGEISRCIFDIKEYISSNEVISYLVLEIIKRHGILLSQETDGRIRTKKCNVNDTCLFCYQNLNVESKLIHALQDIATSQMALSVLLKYMLQYNETKDEFEMHWKLDLFPFGFFKNYYVENESLLPQIATCIKRRTFRSALKNHFNDHIIYFNFIRNEDLKIPFFVELLQSGILVLARKIHVDHPTLSLFCERQFRLLFTSAAQKLK